MVGIILAGGSGSRLYPSTQVVSKQLLPVYSSPLIYHSLCFLMRSGIKQFVVITNTHNVEPFRQMLGTGSQWGVEIIIVPQDKPNGLAEAYILAEPYAKGRDTVLMLGDNMFYGADISGEINCVESRMYKDLGFSIFGYHVKDASRYGVIEFEKKGSQCHVISVEEKPKKPKSNYAAVGLYIALPDVFERARAVKPSARGELEITDVMQTYLDERRLHTTIFNRGTVWLDAGTTDSLAEASNFVEAVEKRSGQMIACPEEIALKRGYVTDTEMINTIDRIPECDYKNYLKSVTNDHTKTL